MFQVGLSKPMLYRCLQCWLVYPAQAAWIASWISRRRRNTPGTAGCGGTGQRRGDISSACGSHLDCHTHGRHLLGRSGHLSGQHDAWRHVQAKKLVAVIVAVDSASKAELHMDRCGAEAWPAVAKAARYPIPACVDPHG